MLLKPAWLILGAGGVAALHVGKLAPALPYLQQALNVDWVAAGFLLSLVQLAGMLLAVFMGVWTDGLGLRRSLITGLVLMGLASVAGALVTQATWLALTRALEGFGFLMVVVSAPGLIRRLVPPERLSQTMGFWGAYMPSGTALALLVGPIFLANFEWPAWWLVIGLITLWMAWQIARHVPTDVVLASNQGVVHRLSITLGAPGPWLAAFSFAVYSGQWMAVIGFLPTLYGLAGVTGALLGVLTATAAAANIVGNVASGRMIGRGWAVRSNLWLGFGLMAIGSSLAFMPLTEPWPWLRYGAVLLFSAGGGLVPGTLFYLAVRLAPGEHQVATTLGWVQQLSSMGQFAGPPLVAAIAVHVGGWQWTPLFTLSCCALGALMATRLQRLFLRLKAESAYGASA